MIRVLAILALTLACSYPAVAQVETDKDRSGLIGPVRTLRVESAVVSNVSGQLVEGPRVVAQTSSFDEKGNVTEGSVFNADGSLKRKTGWAYTFDAKGRVAERTFLDAGGALTSRAVPTYDDKGRKVETTYFNPDGSVNHIQAYAYDGGKMTRAVHRNPDGTARGSIVYTYDVNNRLMGEAFYKADGTLNQRSVYTYDAQGRETGWTAYMGDGTAGMGITRSYDVKGNVVESSRYANGLLTSREAFTYEFDSRGNWVKRKTERDVIRGGVSKAEIELSYRTITYY